MKKIISLFLTVILLFTCVLVGTTTVYAAKADNSRSIAIVFDNSGSMYDAGDQAWCRATYAMEVLEELHFPEELIANVSVDRYKNLLSRKPRP